MTKRRAILTIIGILLPFFYFYTSYNIRYLKPHISYLISHISHLTSHISHLTSHLSHLTSHISHLTSHASRLTPSFVNDLHLRKFLTYLVNAIQYPLALFLRRSFVTSDVLREECRVHSDFFSQRFGI